MSDNAAVNFLKTLLGRRLRITTTDTRIFIGEFKCTDNECNVILSGTHEYRHPSPAAVAAAASPRDGLDGESDAIKLDMTSRYLGLVVVPGQHIIKIELEEPS